MSQAIDRRDRGTALRSEWLMHERTGRFAGGMLIATARWEGARGDTLVYRFL